MGFPPNPEKQDFIQLRLEQDPRPGGRGKKEARKYYGGLYHRLAAEVRRAEVQECKARQGGEEDGGEEARVGGGRWDKAAAAADPEAEGKKDSLVAGAETGADVDATDEASDEQGKPDHDVSAGGDERRAEEARSTVADVMTDEQTGEAENSERKGEDPPASEQDHVISQRTAEKEGTYEGIDNFSEDKNIEGSNAFGTDPQPPSSPSASDEKDVQDLVSPKYSNEERETLADEEEQGAQPTTPASKGPAADVTTSRSPQTIPRSESPSVSAAVLSVPNQLVGDGAPSQAETNDDEAASLEDQLARAFEDEDEHIPAHAETESPSTAVTPGSNGSQGQGAQEEDRGFADLFGREDDPDAETSSQAQSFIGGDQETPESYLEDEKRPPVDNETDDEQSPPDESLGPETFDVLSDQYSAGETDDSDADASLHPNSPPDNDDNEDDFGTYEDRQEEREDDYAHHLAQNSWRDGGMGYGTEDLDTFLPDALVPHTSGLTSTTKPSDSTSDVKGSQNETSDGVEHDKKRKLSDRRSSLPPEVRAAFVDSTGSTETGRYYGTSTPEGPKQKRPRLKRPGQERSAAEKPAKSEEEPKDGNAQGTGGTSSGGPSFLLGLVN